MFSLNLRLLWHYSSILLIVSYQMPPFFSLHFPCFFAWMHSCAYGSFAFWRSRVSSSRIPTLKSSQWFGSQWLFTLNSAAATSVSLQDQSVILDNQLNKLVSIWASGPSDNCKAPNRKECKIWMYVFKGFLGWFLQLFLIFLCYDKWKQS